MKSHLIPILALSLLGLACQSAPRPEARREAVGKIVNAEFVALNTDPPTYFVTAYAEVPSNVWSSPKLTRRNPDQPIVDGIVEFDFTAVRPTGMTSSAPAKVEATCSIPPVEVDRIRGARIYGIGKGVKEVIFAPTSR